MREFQQGAQTQSKQYALSAISPGEACRPVAMESIVWKQQLLITFLNVPV
jgi:hypothetical protein